MPAAMTTTSPQSERLVATTLSGTGFALSTNYIVKWTTPHGHVGHIEVTTDGAGAFTASIAPGARGSHTFAAHLATETDAATAAASVTHNVA